MLARCDSLGERLIEVDPAIQDPSFSLCSASSQQVPVRASAGHSAISKPLFSCSVHVRPLLHSVSWYFLLAPVRPSTDFIEGLACYDLPVIED